jgi:hypothetical protein
MAKEFVDFAAIKERVGMQEAISFLNLKLTKQEGDQHRFACPACKGGNDRALSINIQKGVFRCFEDRGKGGTDSIALVAHVKGIRQREAAVILDEHFPDRDAKSATSPVKAEPEGRTVPDIAEMLGIGPAAIQALGAGYDGASQRFQIPLRSAAGVQFGSLGIATDAEQRPLLAFTFDEEETKKANIGPDGLRQLFRVVS